MTSILDELAALDLKEKELEDRRSELKDESDPLRKRLTDCILKKLKGAEVAELSAKIRFIDGELRDINLESNRLQRKRGELNRQLHFSQKTEAANRPKILTKYGIFHQVAKEILPEETFLRIWNVVEGRMRVSGSILDDETGQPITFEENGNK